MSLYPGVTVRIYSGGRNSLAVNGYRFKIHYLLVLICISVVWNANTLKNEIFNQINLFVLLFILVTQFIVRYDYVMRCSLQKQASNGDHKSRHRGLSGCYREKPTQERKHCGSLPYSEHTKEHISDGLQLVGVQLLLLRSITIRGSAEWKRLRQRRS